MDTKGIETKDTDLLESAVVAFREVWKKKLLVILITIAGLLTALLYINIKGNTIRYFSSATLFSAVYGSYNDSTQGVNVMNRYTGMLESSRVCSRAAQSLSEYNISAEQLQRMVKSQDIIISGLKSNATAYQITIVVYVDSPETAIPITNAMASAFSVELNELIGSNAIQVMDEANRYQAYSTMNTLKYLLLFSGIAFLATCGVIFCFVFFSPWVRSVEQCESDEKLVLGLIPYSKER